MSSKYVTKLKSMGFFCEEWEETISDPCVRKAIYEAWNGVDYYSGQKIKPSEMVIDHFIPQCMGGPDNLGNYLPTTNRNNSRKSNRTDPQTDIFILNFIQKSMAPRTFRKLEQIREERTKVGKSYPNKKERDKRKIATYEFVLDNQKYSVEFAFPRIKDCEKFTRKVTIDTDKLPHEIKQLRKLLLEDYCEIYNNNWKHEPRKSPCEHLTHWESAATELNRMAFRTAIAKYIIRGLGIDSKLQYSNGYPLTVRVENDEYQQIIVPQLDISLVDPGFCYRYSKFQSELCMEDAKSLYDEAKSYHCYSRERIQEGQTPISFDLKIGRDRFYLQIFDLNQRHQRQLIARDIPFIVNFLGKKYRRFLQHNAALLVDNWSIDRGTAPKGISYQKWIELCGSWFWDSFTLAIMSLLSQRYKDFVNMGSCSRNISKPIGKDALKGEFQFSQNKISWTQEILNMRVKGDWIRVPHK